MNVSFYLLTPNAKTQSQLYVSISNKSSRLRFAAGEEFLIKYCNSREKKGDKTLVKRNTPFTLEYNSILNSISDNLRLLAMQLQREQGEYSLQDVRNIYWTRIGWIDDKNQVTFANAFEQYKEASRIHWSVEFYKIQCAMENHLTEFKKARNESVEFQNFNKDLWESIISYFVLDLKTANSTTNKYLKSLKRFLKYSAKKGYFNGRDLDDWKYLKEHEVFKIALKEHEVEKLINLDLSASKRLEKVRDLFLLEILLGKGFQTFTKY
ncbi:phage integrase SAM-like domain-containing protein [Taibaiella soli]|uniref:Phage integrase SAM-like domain-containing protein n=1 Tax=Taibaiella soli TaxID=1649169 RepID=A0A2W2AF57_9BACT|nr:phage integrase SAM-like domain-containing protein [Taibaiella soli]PZF73931.1 hypothetical protein DN068_06215 [Taibaiella soli]